LERRKEKGKFEGGGGRLIPRTSGTVAWRTDEVSYTLRVDEWDAWIRGNACESERRERKTKNTVGSLVRFWSMEYDDRPLPDALLVMVMRVFVALFPGLISSSSNDFVSFGCLSC
jgi:hypothetical protein